MVISLGRTKQLSGITPGASQERREVNMAKAKGLYRRGKIWWIRYARPDGRIRCESTETTSLKEAEYILACRRKEVREAKLSEVKKIEEIHF